MRPRPNRTGLHKRLEEEEAKTWAHTPMFIAALFPIVKRQQQPKSASTEEWINSVIYAYDGISLGLKTEGNSDAQNHVDES